MKIFFALYTSEFKSWKFGKEAAQILDLERATIVRAQGASEDQKFAAKPTQPKTNFWIHLCIFLVTTSSLLATLPVDTSRKEKPATIKVRLPEHSDSAFLEAKGGYRIYDPSTDLLVISSVSGKQGSISYDLEKGITWKDIFPDLFALRIVPENAQSTLLVNGIEYHGCLEIYVKDNALVFINEIDMENYLRSTLAHQNVDALDEEVIEAVAIIARTQAHYLASSEDTLWHAEAEEVGYEGSGLTGQNLTMEHALYNTQAMIMTFEEKPFPALWHENSAGKTADYAAIFRKNIKTPHAVTTPLAAKERPNQGWFFEISKKALSQRIQIPKISQIDLYQDKSSQKTYAVRINAEDQVSTIDFFTLQNALGDEQLKSNDFQIEVKGDKVCFQGYGQGHGVGLCLWTACLLAEKGQKTSQILSHFFPGTKLVHMAQKESIVNNSQKS